MTDYDPLAQGNSATPPAPPTPDNPPVSEDKPKVTRKKRTAKAKSSSTEVRKVRVRLNTQYKMHIPGQRTVHPGEDPEVILDRFVQAQIDGKRLVIV